MSFLEVTSGHDVPNDINVIIEIPANGTPVKYEVDKENGLLNVDRFFLTPMFYPVNYGYIPQTLSEDGDPVDVLVVTPVPLLPGVLIRCRVIGMLNMTDESGVDMKLLAVPIKKLSPIYDEINTYEDLPVTLLKTIEHFFSHYKDLDTGKWVKLDGWESADRARHEILSCIARYQGSQIVF